VASGDYFPIRWTRSFMRADAEQPTGTFRMLLAELRKNQWVLLNWRTAIENRFYPFKKVELVPRLEGQPSELAVGAALRLENRPSSQTVDNDEERLFTGVPENNEDPWLSRKVLLDAEGTPIAIGTPRIPRDHIVSNIRRKIERIEPEKSETAVYLPPPRLELPLEYSIVRIFYATDRQKAADGGSYTSSRDCNEHLSLGTCDVTIPRDHRMAILESPRWWRFEFRKNPGKHITLQAVNELSGGDFFSMLGKSVSEDVDHSILVFIHGFCVSFEDAARRTAQLSYDLGFKGAPVLYSWPSAGSVSGYMTDEATIEWTKPHLSSFLHDLANRTGAHRIHVIAHSMGNRALVKILDSGLSVHQRLYDQIVLTAPDIDAGEFLQLASRIRSAADRITLYASSNDNAILLSKKIHTYPRAGESGADIVVVTGLDTVDASSVDTSLMGHSYYAEERTVLSDLFYLLKDGAPPSGRHGLERKECSKGEYWAFRP
jgi:esterase/lipase superfamily enzyme